MKTLKQFLTTVYSKIEKRRDSYLELGLALASTSQVESVVALSEHPLYRRRFSSVYETLREVKLDETGLLKANLGLFEATCQKLSGYEVYSGDATFIKRNDAKTLAERVMKRFSNGELAYGHESYWTNRLSHPEHSWTGVALVERITQGETVTTMAAKQMKFIDIHNEQSKLFVFDAGHGLDLLEAGRECQYSDIILRVKSHQVFYYDPSYKGRGRPPKYGERFKLSDLKKEADSKIIIPFKKNRLRISTWTDLHASKFMDISLTILKLEFLDDKDLAVFKKPIWLITTATELDAEVLARAYLWRASHELTFRFMKQHLGLGKNNSPELRSCDNWLQLVALSMNILLALRAELNVSPKPWYKQVDTKTVSQRQAQQQALSFFLKLHGIINPPQPAGKAWGRPFGHQPPRRIRHLVTRKTPIRKKPCPACPFKQAA